MFAQRHPGKLSWCLALPSWHAWGHDLAVTDYPRPPSEAYLPERDASLKPCQTISPGIYQSKSPLGHFHCVMQDVIPKRGDHSVRTVIIRHPVSGTLGKQTCLELTTPWKPGVKHWEAQTPLSMVKIPLEKVPLPTQLPGKVGGITNTLQGDLQEWDFGCRTGSF